MKSHKDGITIEMLMYGGKKIIEAFSVLFNQILEEKPIPNKWNDSLTTLLYEKGDKANLQNYHPIILLSVIYKVLNNRLTSKLDEYQHEIKLDFIKNSVYVTTMKTLIEDWYNKYQ